MHYTFGKTVVIALGGSIAYPQEIDTSFLKQFRKFIQEDIKRTKHRFVIVIGGGRLARVFQDAASKVASLTNEDKDWIGIHSTRLNGHLLRTIFRDIADPVVFDSRKKIKKLRHPVTIASGWRPGWSTDYVAAAIACDLKIPEFIVAGKPAFVYSADPGKIKNTIPFESISWGAYRKLIPGHWIPGFHAPVDPVAARLAQTNKRTAIIINGKNLKNFRQLLSGKSFQGTVIG